MKEKSVQPTSTLPKRLRYFYGIGEFGQQFSLITINMYLLYYYTNVMGISGKAAGTLMLVARIWDAINDPMMGMIIDNTHSKHGKCRPYLLYCALPAGLFLFLTFSAPQMSNTAKLVWAYCTYIGQGMLYTATGISYTSLISRIADNPLDRVALNQSRALISLFSAVLISAMTLPIVQSIGANTSEATGFSITVGCYGALQAICYLGVFLLTRGYDRQEPKVVQEPGQSASKEMFKSLGYVVKNPMWRWLASCTLLYYISSGTTQGVLVYYVKYYLERPDLVGVATMCSMISSLFAIVLLKVFAKKFGKAKSLRIGLIIGICGLLVRFISRDHIIPLYLACLLTAGFGLGMFVALMVPSLMDSIDYGEWKFGHRNDALVMSANSFGNKLGGGIASGALGFLLDAMGYDASLTVQSASVHTGLFCLSAIVPLVICTIIFFVLRVYQSYEAKMPAIRAELAERRKTAASAAEPK